jgi:peroxiredoxin
MASRKRQRQERRGERLRREQEARRAAQRQKLLRRAGYGAVAVMAAALITLAVVLGGGNTQPPADHMAANGGGPAIGATAPAFKLTDVVSGRRVTAASLRGHETMLFFSEGVSCQACLVQAADLQKDATLRKAGIQLVSVTTDQPGDLAQAARQYGITTPMLADPSTNMSNAYGMLGHGGMGHTVQDGHAFMLLAPDGRVLWHQAYQDMYVAPGQLMHDMRIQVKS